MLDSLPPASILSRFRLFLVAAPASDGGAVVTEAHWDSLLYALVRLENLAIFDVVVSSSTLRGTEGKRHPIHPAVCAFFERSTEEVFPSRRHYAANVTFIQSS